jgi:hypothetical protein
MAADVQNRKTIREAFGALLVAAIEGAGKPAQKVYDFIVKDFKGKYATVALDSRPSIRSKQAQVTRVSSGIKLDTHLFVLYSDDPTPATNSPTAGNNKAIEMADTSLFAIGDEVFVEDAAHYEVAVVTAVSTNVSITAATLIYSYTTPKVYWWNEKLAANRLDLLEKEISDLLMDNDTNETWEQVAFDGEPSRDDIAIGGKEYLHEVIHLLFTLKSD